MIAPAPRVHSWFEILVAIVGVVLATGTLVSSVLQYRATELQALVAAAQVRPDFFANATKLDDGTLVYDFKATGGVAKYPELLSLAELRFFDTRSPDPNGAYRCAKYGFLALEQTANPIDKASVIEAAISNRDLEIAKAIQHAVENSESKRYLAIGIRVYVALSYFDVVGLENQEFFYINGDKIQRVHESLGAQRIDVLIKAPGLRAVRGGNVAPDMLPPAAVEAYLRSADGRCPDQ